VDLRERESAASGADEAAFLIRPNPGLPFAHAAETASGGELSRIALAIAAVGGGETMVFDEIDAGIGGQTAHAMGETLQRLAGRAQVITITHLPQIATLAEQHFRVEKVAGDPTHTTIEALEDDDRREELRRMLGGEQFISAVQEQ
jgi:DNA repair protein RecN (Recombination protein N)